jgi:hypothetical protein
VIGERGEERTEKREEKGEKEGIRIETGQRQ